MPSSDIVIQQFRISFIRFETIPTLLGPDVPDQKSVPFSFLGRSSTYELMFNQIQQKVNGIPNLTLPWKDLRSSTHYFWYYYLQERETYNVNAKRAWEGFVPFRSMTPYNAEASWIPAQGQLIQEAFYYPYGVAYVATAYCEGTFSLDDAVNLALSIRQDKVFNIQQNKLTKDSTPEQDLSLDDLAKKSLDQLRIGGWGIQEEQGRRSTAFTIFTVVKAVGVNKETPPDTELKSALEKVTSWGFYSPILPLPLKKKTDVILGDVLYASNNGRAVWLPGTFLVKPASLAAYHRNLTLTSMQVMSLCGLILASQAMLNEPLPPIYSECLRRALKKLGQLYGNKQSYHSYSARAQLDMNVHLMKDVNDVLQFWNMNILVAPTSLNAGNV